MAKKTKKTKKQLSNTKGGDGYWASPGTPSPKVTEDKIKLFTVMNKDSNQVLCFNGKREYNYAVALELWMNSPEGFEIKEVGDEII